MSQKRVVYDIINLNKSHKENIEVSTDPYEACKESHAILVLTEWDEFVELIGRG